MTYSAEVLADTPVAYYRLNDTGTTTVADSSGNGLNGTLTKDSGTFAYTQGVAPLINEDTALQLVRHDGQGGDYINLGNSTSLRLSGSFSLEAWIYLPTNAETYSPAIISQQYNGSSINYMLGFQSGAADSFKPSVGFFNGGWRIAQSASAISRDAPHHLVGTWDGTVLRIYVDGTEAANNTPGSSPSSPSTSNYRIGSRWDSPGGLNLFLTATLDDVAIYSSALSSARVLAHYQAGSVKLVAVGQITETDTANAFVIPKRRLANLASETDLAQVMTPVAPDVVAVSRASETDLAQVFAHSRRMSFGQATETDAARTVAAAFVDLTASQATETDQAMAFAALKQAHGPGGGGSPNGVSDFWVVEVV